MSSMQVNLENKIKDNSHINAHLIGGNSRLIGGCQGTIYGCCKDGVTEASSNNDSCKIASPILGGLKTISCGNAFINNEAYCSAGTKNCYDNSPYYCNVGKSKTIYCMDGSSHTCPEWSKGCYDNSPEYCRDIPKPVKTLKTIYCSDGTSQTCLNESNNCYDDSPMFCKTPAIVGNTKTISCSSGLTNVTCPSGTQDCYDNSPHYCCANPLVKKVSLTTKNKKKYPDGTCSSTDNNLICTFKDFCDAKNQDCEKTIPTNISIKNTSQAKQVSDNNGFNKVIIEKYYPGTCDLTSNKTDLQCTFGNYCHKEDALLMSLP